MLPTLNFGTDVHLDLDAFSHQERTLLVLKEKASHQRPREVRVETAVALNPC